MLGKKKKYFYPMSNNDSHISDKNIPKNGFAILNESGHLAPSSICNGITLDFDEAYEAKQYLEGIDGDTKYTVVPIKYVPAQIIFK